MANAVIGDLTRKVGPLPVWGYGAIAGGVLLVVMGKRGSPVASAALNPSIAAPALPGDTSTVPSGGDATGGSGSGTTAGTAVGSPDGTVTDVSSQAIFGNGSLSDLIKNLGPDYTQFDFRTGQTGVDVSHSAQNAIDSQNYQSQLAYSLGLLQAQNLATQTNTAAQVASYKAQADAQHRAYIDHLKALGLIPADTQY